MNIIAAYQEVGTYRGAADICGTTHKTVKRVIDRAEAGETVAVARAERPRNYDPVAELVTKRVVSSEGRISAKRLLPIAQAAGYAGSARNFRRLVAAQKALWRRDHHRGRRPAVWTPGEYLVIDWATVGGGLHLFCAVLAWSRWRFVAFATDEKATTTLALIAAPSPAVSASAAMPKLRPASRHHGPPRPSRDQLDHHHIAPTPGKSPRGRHGPQPTARDRTPEDAPGNPKNSAGVGTFTWPKPGTANWPLTSALVSAS
jgi:hypothetical protein